MDAAERAPGLLDKYNNDRRKFYVLFFFLRFDFKFKIYLPVTYLFCFNIITTYFITYKVLIYFG